MGDREVRTCSAKSLKAFECRAAELQKRLTRFIRLYLDVYPFYIACPSCAERFESRFFGCKAACIMSDVRAAGFAVGPLVCSEDARYEPLSIALDRRLDSRDLDDVNSQSDYHVFYSYLPL